MLCDFNRCTEKVGLKTHPEKTNILSNQSSNKRQEVTISNIKVEVLPIHECAKYLGQRISFQQQETTEIRSRIRAAQASFCRYKQELTSRSYPVQHKLRLFNMVISPTMGYACGTWTLTNEHEGMIRSSQRKKLRLTIKTRRKYKKKKTTSNLKIKKATLKKKKAKRTPKTVHKKEAAQTPIATKTATSSLPKTLKKRSTQLNLNKKTGLIT